MRKLLSFISAVSLLLSISCAVTKPSEKQLKTTEKEIEAINNTSTTIATETQTLSTDISSTITEAIPDKSVEEDHHYRGFIIDCNGEIIVFNENSLRKFSHQRSVYITKFYKSNIRNESKNLFNNINERICKKQ